MTRTSQVIAFVQFGYRLENKTFTRSLVTLLEGVEATGLYLTDDSSVSHEQQLGPIRFLRYSNSETSATRSLQKQQGVGEVAGEQTQRSVGALRRRAYLLKRDIAGLRAWVRKTRWVYAALAGRNDIVAVVGIEPAAALTAAIVGSLLKVRHFYCSMELAFQPFRTGLLNRLWRTAVGRAARTAAAVTVQDFDRGAALCRVLSVPREKVILLPVGTTDGKAHARTTYLRDKLNIPRDRKIVLYAGSIRDWACVREIAESVRTWPAEFCLVVHGFIASREDPYVQSVLRYVDNARVFLSTDLLEWDDLDRLLCSADMSIAAYRMDEENMKYISSSSNKLASYARCGLPVVLSSSENVERMFDTVRWGEAFQGFEEVGEKISKIHLDYPTYREHCYEAFDRFYDLRRYGSEFIEAVTRANAPVAPGTEVGAAACVPS